MTSQLEVLQFRARSPCGLLARSNFSTGRQVVGEIGLTNPNRASASANPMAGKLAGFDKLIDTALADVESLSSVTDL